MFPYIKGENGCHAIGKRTILVGGGDDLELARVAHQLERPMLVEASPDRLKTPAD